ncbi:MBL fold metallo-hydrolase [Cohnella caldifontis]|uniref:MBL fold metallo-hydrolase n=1 Tax=Cohnella caldifontis TaxID=3027471 RepID=UPI0023ED08E4|nr:MBL fold metallo-hydrolase [Cohnella sp. YIM B05605]
MHAIDQIGNRFWYMTPVSDTDRPILGMVVGDKKTLMIDAGNSEKHARRFLDELRKRNVPDPDLVVLTHWHWDHIFGLSALTDTVSIASKETKKEVEKLRPLSWSDEALDTRVEEGTEIEFCANAIKKEFADDRNITILLPDVGFENRLEIDLGGVTCLLQQVGGSHASDSVVAYLKEEKLLFLGDCMYADIYADQRNYKIHETIRLLDQLEAFDAETYILSHWKPIPKEEFDAEVTMLRTVAAFTDSFKGNKRKIIAEYKNAVGRDLSEDELQVIDEFVNGYS